jgi:autotransporter-associated beta strand protein
MLPLAAGAAVSMGSLAGSALAQSSFTWIAPASGTFGTSSNWQENAFPSVGDPTTALTFATANTAAITATQDRGDTFQLNTINFNTNGGAAFTFQGGLSTIFHTAGPNATITLSGNNLAADLIAGTPVDLAADLNVNGTGSGSLEIDSALIEQSGSHSLTISGGNPNPALRIVTLGGNNSFTGGLRLDGGTVAATGSFSNKNQLGAPGGTLTVTANGGTYASTMVGGQQSSLGTIQLNGDLHVIGSFPLTLGAASPPTDPTTSATLQGTGTLYLTQAATALTVANNSSGFTGAVVIDQSQLPSMATLAGGQLTSAAVSGVNTPSNGSLHGVTSFDVRAGGTLLLNNSVTDSVQNGDRIADTTPVRLRSGGLILTAPALAGAHGFAPSNLTEAIGVLSFAGNSLLQVTPTGGSSPAVVTTLQPDSLVRLERGTLAIYNPPNQGTSTVATMGDGSTPNRARSIFSNPVSGLVGGGGAQGTTTVSIIPWAIGHTASANQVASFVTYGADGLRQLLPAEFVSNTLGPSIDLASNVSLTVATPHSGTDTINSLFLTSAPNSSVDGSVTGTGTLNITSGAVMAMPVNGMTSISNNLAFGSAEAVFTVGNTGMLMSGVLTGTNGLTMTTGTAGSGYNTMLALTGNNSGLTGPLTINSGFVQFNSASALPGTGTIVANGSIAGTQGKAAGLAYSGSSALTMSRDIAVNTGYMTFLQKDMTVTTQPVIGNLTVSGLISGVGSMNYQPQSGGHIFVTNTGNTYSGVTRFAAGTTHVAGEGSLGSGGAIEFAGGNLTLEGDLANSRHINISAFSGGPVIDTNGHNATFNGPITDFRIPDSTGSFKHQGQGFTKTGAGTLNLTNAANTLSGPVTVSGGTLLINGRFGSSGAMTVTSGATLGGSGTLYRPVTVASGGTLAPGNSPGILTVWGALSLAPASGAPATLRMELNGPVAGSGYDQVQLVASNTTSAATVLLGTAVPANLVLSLGFAPAAHSRFWLITNTDKYLANLGSADTTTGAFAGLPEGATVSLGTFGGVAYTGLISYHGDFDTDNPTAGNGNDVVIYNVTSTPTCGSVDFNCDGDVGTDADIEAFFACLSGTCPPPPCTSNADFNGDGDVGTDADIEAFFRVLAGGTC